MDVLNQDLLRQAFGDDGDRAGLDHAALQNRGRRRRVSRILTGSLSTVAAFAVIGSLALMNQQDTRTLLVEPLAGPPPEESVEEADVVNALADEIWFEIRPANDVTDEPGPDCHVWVDYGSDLHGRIGGVMLCGEVRDNHIELDTLTVGIETGETTIDTLDADTTLVLGLVDETVTQVRASFSDGEVRQITTTDLRGLPDAPPFRVALLAVDGPVTVTGPPDGR